MKNLFLENGLLSESEDFLSDLKDFGIEFDDVIESAHYDVNKERVYKAVMTCENLYFQSTFTRPEQIYSIAKLLLTKENPTNVYFYSLAFESMEYIFKSIFGEYQIKELKDKGVKFFQYNYGEEEFEKAFEELDLYSFIPKYLDSLITNFYDLGFKIKINDVKAFGKAFNTLKNGDVLDAYHETYNDKKKYWGVWVEGNGEKVKLVVSDNYFEWELDESSYGKAVAVLQYLASLSAMPDKEKFENIPVKDWLEMIKLSPTKKGQENIDMLINMFLDEFGLEKRMNRSIIIKTLDNYKSKHNYIFEQ